MHKLASVGLSVGLGVGAKSNQRSVCVPWSGNTGEEEQIYRKQYENIALVHGRVVVHVGLPG